MWKQFFSKIVGVSSETRYDLIFSLRPIFCSLQIFGIDLDVSPPRSIHRRCGFILLKMLSFVFMQISSFEIALTSLRSQMNFNSTRNWLNVLRSYTWLTWDILFPTVMFYTTTFNWKRLWRRAKKLEKLMKFQSSFVWQLRTVSISLIASVAVLVNSGQISFE